ncbi:MAG: hypothetical protein JEZ00_19085 [Anaerolineaceae bacterium]|nr:hypothetical protein [Anaerolineaceae bacterium]
MDSSLQTYKQKTIKYWWIDGLAEIAFGFEMWTLAICLLLSHLFNVFEWGVLFASIGIPLLFIISIFGVGKVVKILKERITYPRTGYVRYPKRQSISRLRRLIIGGGIGFSTAILVNLALVYFGPAARWTIIGLIMMMTMIYIASVNGVNRYYLTGILTFFWGISMIWIPAPESTLFGWFFAGVGMIFFLSGLIVFIRYLQRYPKIEGDEYVG